MDYAFQIYKKKTTVSSCLLKYNRDIISYQAIFANIELNVSLGRIALLVNSGLGW